MTGILFYGVVLVSMMMMVVKANLSPSNPEPGTVWTAGREYEITWEEDNTEPALNATWKNFRIDLMTGEDNDQVLLTNIAENVKGDVMKYKYTAPLVDPPAPIYFLMFTNEDGEFAWSTRFAIVGPNGMQEVPEKSVQPTGEKIPWGVGKLVSDVSSESIGEKDAEADASSAVPSSPASKTAAASPSALSASQQASKPVAAASSQVNGQVSVRAATASPSVASARKGNVSEMKSTSNAQPSVSLTMVGGVASFAVGLFLF